MVVRKLFAATAMMLVSASALHAQVTLYDNGAAFTGNPTGYGLVTNPGGGGGGLDASALTSPPDTVFGFSISTATTAFRLSDQFTVPSGQQWTINSVHVFAYQTGATVNPITAGTLRIWDNAPNAPGAAILAGDTTTNVLSGSAFSNIYRVTTTTLTTTNRLIFDSTLTLGTPLVLNPGTYWADWGLTFLTGTVTTGFAPPITVATPGTPGIVTGDALQFSSATSAWVAVLDTGNPAASQSIAKGMPFTVVGTAVPEPTSMALAGVAVFGYGVRRFRKRS